MSLIKDILLGVMKLGRIKTVGTFILSRISDKKNAYTILSLETPKEITS